MRKPLAGERETEPGRGRGDDDSSDTEDDDAVGVLPPEEGEELRRIASAAVLMTGSPASAKIQKTTMRQRSVRKWTPQEDELLRRAVRDKPSASWKVIALNVPGRSHIQCLQRWNKCLAPGLRKGAWSAQEDAWLAERVAEQTARAEERKIRWGLVSKVIPGRTAKQCRERWVNNLNPSISRQPWTPEEDRAVMMLFEQHGPSWVAIAKAMPGRTENGVKIRWRSLTRGSGARTVSSAAAVAASRAGDPTSLNAAIAGLEIYSVPSAAATVAGGMGAGGFGVGVPMGMSMGCFGLTMGGAGLVPGYGAAAAPMSPYAVGVTVPMASAPFAAARADVPGEPQWLPVDTFNPRPLWFGYCQAHAAAAPAGGAGVGVLPLGTPVVAAQRFVFGL